MRLHKHLRIFATAITVAALSAPAAHAEAISNSGGGGPVTTHQVAAVSHHTASNDWALIALAGGGTVVLVGAGLGASRRANRRHESARKARAPHIA
jgi:hypothetical protein